MCYGLIFHKAILMEICGVFVLDFNFVCSPSERIWVDAYFRLHGSVDCLAFSSFIYHIDFINLLIFGSNLSWFQSNGGVSRLDRILIYEGWRNL